ncbi:MAG: hypothetical protein M3Y08_20150 [Fibrobacterota bacterium]|nr:hypothetical protein [Fibrobacterota bacterium]
MAEGALFRRVNGLSMGWLGLASTGPEGSKIAAEIERSRLNMHSYGEGPLNCIKSNFGFLEINGDPSGMKAFFPIAKRTQALR